ncbi:MAG: hypothetical protein C0404_10425 [Verrucomicrobia bacterium]|nr:hypothetical protein [Verrucomicrobiota bacterium]
MTKEMTVLSGVLVIAVLAGCRTPASTPRNIASSAVPDDTAQIVAFSNEVNRLSQRVRSLEQDWSELKPSMQFIKKLMDEMRYAPVVHEELIGVTTNDTGTNAPNHTSDDIHRPAAGR